MRKITFEATKNAVKTSLIKINYNLEDSFVKKLEDARDKETQDVSKSILDDIIENQKIARRGVIPLCQDTGLVVAFVEMGRNVFFDGDIGAAINAGVSAAYEEGYLRKSVVKHPFNRENTQDNTPAVIHTEFTKGEEIKIKLAAKGAGSENMSKVVMLKPSDGIEGVKQLVKDTIFKAGGRPCPPIIVGIGIGGNLEKSALLSKEALLRDLDDQSSDPTIRDLENTLYDEINALGVGAMGVGGDITCMGVKINYYPMHIASLPVAINIQCHANRHDEVIL